MCIDNLLFLCEVYMYVSTYVYVYYVYVWNSLQKNFCDTDNPYKEVTGWNKLWSFYMCLIHLTSYVISITGGKVWDSRWKSSVWGLF
jgi:hypothetical protein